ncbi:MAG TPA: hypothetical protein VFX96_00495 [Pyrinomonadaceae bacterium]|nr:hypothetical protein [Pyrinomonadaceae bacterium]
MNGRKTNTHAPLNEHALPLVLGLSHAFADAAAGALLVGLSHSMALSQVALFVVLYNVIAFGAQPVFGHFADRARRPREAALAGLALLACALFAARIDVSTAVVLAGIGSSLFHVGGGALALCATEGRATGPGLFAAPGVVGLAAGGALAFAGYDLTLPLAAALVALGLVVRRFGLPPMPYDARAAEPTLDGKELILVALLAAVALRSAVWTSAQYLFEGRYSMLLVLAFAACAGKLVGGALAELFGWRRWTAASLVAAAPLVLVGESSFAALAGGVFLLQSATPACIAAVGRLLPRRPATAAGLALGLGIAAGGFFIFGGLFPSPRHALLAPAALIVAALCLWLAMRRKDEGRRRNDVSGLELLDLKSQI